MNHLRPASCNRPSPTSGSDFDALLAQVRSTVPEYPETIYFVGPDDPSENEIQGWIARLLAEGQIEEGAYSLRWVTLSSGVRKPAVDRGSRTQTPLKTVR